MTELPGEVKGVVDNRQSARTRYPNASLSGDLSRFVCDGLRIQEDGTHFLPLEGKVDSERSFEDGWGETVSQQPWLQQGFCASPTPSPPAAEPPRPQGRGRRHPEAPSCPNERPIPTSPPARPEPAGFAPSLREGNERGTCVSRTSPSASPNPQGSPLPEGGDTRSGKWVVGRGTWDMGRGS